MIYVNITRGIITTLNEQNLTSILCIVSNTTTIVSKINFVLQSCTKRQ